MLSLSSKMIRLIFSLFIVIFAFSACSTKYSLDNRITNAKNLVSNTSFIEEDIFTSFFVLKSYFKIENPNMPIKFYIEGDGFAWINKNTISSNPTPINPVALKLALQDNYPNIAYIARPCQFIDDLNCNEQYWTNKRFSQEVIDSFVDAITILKDQSDSKKVELVGFSGGAAISVLVAANRNDVSKITTIAGNLNHELLNRYHHVSQLKGSLNPVNVAAKVSNIKQVHFISLNDKLIPPKIVESFVEKTPYDADIKVIELNEPTHTQNWEKHIFIYE